MAVATRSRQSGAVRFSMITMRTAIILSMFSVYTAFGTGLNKAALKEQALEMFRHAYWSYMNNAFPHDELMPLSCTGRIRGVTPSRGDVDDSLGNFSLTLVDSLDTLVVMGEYDEFERAVRLVVDNVRFDADVIVSVFETNIRMVGGLISAHLMARLLKNHESHRLQWYDQQLLDMSVELADRLLPAFNTTSGLPFPRINLRRGVVDYLRDQKDTCTACGGTMILEMAALSRLTGNPIYEQKATKAMDFLWQQRHRGSDLMGTVLNVHSGDWVRRDSGIGAGIDSYYEYCLKAYILLGDEMYLQRFNTHYDAIMRYVNKGPMFIDVHMHKPTVASRPFMDSLLAFWPGLQVLKGDLKPAIEIHEMLHQVVQRHKFLPEAFTHDLQVHWAQHPLRPEFVESTYFLYRATKDEHYLHVAKQVMDSLNEHVRFPCGFAGVKDLRTMLHEDRMDSFVLAETFKYLYMIFAEPSDLIFDPDSYVFTTEAHFLPLSIGATSPDAPPRRVIIDPDELLQEDGSDGKVLRSACPNTRVEFRGEMSSYAKLVRGRVSVLLGQIAKSVEQSDQPQTCTQSGGGQRLKATSFIAANKEHVDELQRMGIQMSVQTDGRVQLTHSAAGALSPEMSEYGVMFMQEMIQLSKLQQQQEQDVIRAERIVQIVSGPLFGSRELLASPAQFGGQLDGNEHGVEATATIASPFRACSSIENKQDMVGKIAIVERSDCMFQEKARFAQAAGSVGVIVIDHFEDTSASESPFFAMSGDGSQDDDIKIPVVFLFRREGNLLLDSLKRYPASVVRVAEKPRNPARLFVDYLLNMKRGQRPPASIVCPLSGGGDFAVSCVEKDNEITCISRATDSGAPTNGQKECVNDGAIETCVQRIGDQVITVRRELPATPLLRPIAVVDDRIGHRQITFNFDLTEQTGPPMSTIEEKRRAVDSLMARFAAETNINTLPRGNSYMAVARKLAYTSLGVNAPLGEFDERMLAEMVSELVIKHQPPFVVGTVVLNQMTCSLSDNGAVDCAQKQEKN